MNQVITAAPLIQASGLTKHYPGFSLAGVNVTVEPGQVVGFVGKNGSGKSTTIKALLGLISLDAGQASVLGYSPRDLANTASARAKEQVGVVFDTISLPGHLKIEEVGKLMARAYSTWDAAGFQQRLRAADLDPKKAVKDLSRGMGMKLSLACALSHNPRLLILDEATAGLDPMARDEVLDALRDFVAVEDAQGNPVNGIASTPGVPSSTSLRTRSATSWASLAAVPRNLSRSLVPVSSPLGPCASCGRITASTCWCPIASRLRKASRPSRATAWASMSTWCS